MTDWCSFSTSLTAKVVNLVVEERDEMFSFPDENECCECLGRCSIGYMYELGFACLFVVGVIEAVVRTIFAIVTLPAVIFGKDGRDFYRKFSMRGLVSTWGALALTAYALFANLFEKNLAAKHMQASIYSESPVLLGPQLNDMLRNPAVTQQLFQAGAQVANQPALLSQVEASPQLQIFLNQQLQSMASDPQASQNFLQAFADNPQALQDAMRVTANMAHMIDPQVLQNFISQAPTILAQNPQLIATLMGNPAVAQQGAAFATQFNT